MPDAGRRGGAAALAHAVTAHLTSWSPASAAEDLGVLHARATGGTDQETAIHRLDQALNACQQAGAQRDVARPAAPARRTAPLLDPNGRPSDGDSLTETERNVAALAAQGLTNPQIAARMFISRDTVKFHLSQVFRKLDIASGVELAHQSGPHGFRRDP